MPSLLKDFTLYHGINPYKNIFKRYPDINNYATTAMDNGSTHRRSMLTTLPAIETLQRNVRKVPTYNARKPRDIPFHLPHKKLVERIEYVEKDAEPLTGFAAAQEERIKNERKTGKIQLEPIKLDDGVKKKKAITIQESRSSVDNDKPADTTDPLKVKPVVASQKEVIETVRNDPTGGFLYMIYAVHPQNVYFTPYYLNVVPYENINKVNYFTISACGVTHYTNEMVFTKLSDWEREYVIFMKFTDIKFFRVYRYWKAFYVWRKSILFRKFSKMRTRIAKKLFILTPVMGKALLSIQAMCCDMYMKSFADVSRDMDTAFFYFIEVQMKRVEYVRDKLQEFRCVVLEVITAACHAALYHQGFTYDDRNVPPFQIIRGKPTGGMSYTEKANKRKYCERLACLIKLVDYMKNYMLYRLTKRSNMQMGNMLRTHVEFTPSLELLSGKDVDEVLEAWPRQIDVCKWALFQVDTYILPSGEVELNPSEHVISSYMQRITDYWDEYVRTFHNYLNDETLQIFVQPIIMGKQMEWTAGESPSLYFLMNQDKTLLNDIQFISRVHHDGYDKVRLFLERMKRFMENFREAHVIDLNIIKNERDVNVFRSLCTELVKQMEEIEEVVSFQPLGLIFLNLSPFQELFRPQPRKLFEVVNSTTPEIGHDSILHILEGIESINNDISKEPETAGELVAFNSLLDGLEKRVAYIEERLEYLRELYDLMGEFNIGIPPDDMNEFLGLSVILGTLRTDVDARLETRGKLAGLFASQIGKDIMDLIVDVNKLREEIAKPWLYDEKSEAEKVIETLNDLMEKLTDFSARDKQIRDWQKIFKIPPARLEMLDEALSDVKLRQMLWKSSKEWNELFKLWYEVPFNTLDVDDIQATTGSYGKIFNQLDKGLPPNKILPGCKATIDVIKEKLPVMSYLRNPALKPRHWVKIEEILRTRITPDMVLTLKVLEDLQAFQHAEELMEVAGQASSEAGLEALLKKVEEIWATLEFPVILHKDARDVFVLGGLDEIQAAVDESNIHISTILSSRNCGPIRSRVEEWAKNLELFSRTVDEWFLCQQTWIYLEVIFSAPDIQRQLPNETRLFTIVDKSWKDIMRKVAKVPLAMPAATQPKLYEEFVRNNEMLDQIMKCLEAYLETKRVAFPRFFFLSNDELLEILAQTRNPHAVQPHLRKCFDAIAKLEFCVKLPESEMEITEDGTLVEREMSFNTRDALQARLAKTAKPEDLTTDIIAMLSPEGERVNLGKGLKARGNVEDWLGKVEEAMFASVKRCMKFALRDYMQRPRVDWVSLHPNQVVLAVSQMMWAKGVHEIFDLEIPLRIDTGLLNYEKKCISDLNDLAALTRKDLTSLFRKVLCALITVDVHARDTISQMVDKHVQKAVDFEWLKMIRYYWEEDIDNCVARMSSSMYIYGHEYLGAGGVLVITPLTDRCYLCLMGALQLDLGGAPAGPAGTGKTETTKDLAKALAIQCVVFNCSEGLDYKMMGRFFSGLATSGAWCCFDEFNRIDIEVLSVIAQQLITIRNAKVAKQARFMFEGREIKLVRTCAAFITMNPGYAGRTELPDNLKALFRPISMMVPDYEMEVKDMLNKSNKIYHHMDRSIDVSYTEDQMLTALDSLNADSKFPQESRLLDDESFLKALKEDQGRATNMSLFDEIRLSFCNMSRLNTTDLNCTQPLEKHVLEDFTTISTQTDDKLYYVNKNEIFKDCSCNIAIDSNTVSTATQTNENNMKDANNSIKENNLKDTPIHIKDENLSDSDNLLLKTLVNESIVKDKDKLILMKMKKSIKSNDKAPLDAQITEYSTKGKRNRNIILFETKINKNKPQSQYDITKDYKRYNLFIKNNKQFRSHSDPNVGVVKRAPPNLVSEDDNRRPDTKDETTNTSTHLYEVFKDIEVMNVGTQTESIELVSNNNNVEVCYDCTKCIECDRLKRYVDKLESDISYSKLTITEMDAKLEQYEDNLENLSKYIDESNEKNNFLKAVADSLQAKLILIEGACIKQGNKIGRLLSDTCCIEVQTESEQTSVSTQAEVPCGDCLKRNAPHRSIRRYLWEPLKSLFQLFAVLCFMLALWLLYGVTRRWRTCRDPLPWSWLQPADLLDLFLTIEYVSDVPM